MGAKAEIEFQVAIQTGNSLLTAATARRREIRHRSSLLIIL